MVMDIDIPVMLSSVMSCTSISMLKERTSDKIPNHVERLHLQLQGQGLAFLFHGADPN